jgi:CRISPR-associated protein Cas1
VTILTEKPTLFVVARKNDLLAKYGENFRIIDSQTQEVKQKIPALAIRDVIICGDITLDSGVFALAQKHFLPIHFVSSGGKFKASVTFNFSKNVFLRHKQYQLFNDADARLALAKIFVAGKIHNQNVMLQKIRAKGRIKDNTQKAKNLETLRGVEGAAARKYFSIWQQESLIKNQQMEFVGRRKFPATDPINSLLSFCFTLLHSEIQTQLLIAGLDPFTGFLHDHSYGHPAFASDLIEPFRGAIEHFILRSVNRREFDAIEDFETEEGGAVKLSREGYQKFFPKWSDFLRKEELFGEKNITQLIERDVRKFSHFLMEDREDFTTFKWQK